MPGKHEKNRRPMYNWGRNAHIKTCLHHLHSKNFCTERVLTMTAKHDTKKLPKILALALCALTLLALAACGDGKAGSTVSSAMSQAGSSVSSAVSKVESKVESALDTDSSRDDDGPAGSSRLESSKDISQDPDGKGSSLAE